MDILNLIAEQKELTPEKNIQKAIIALMYLIAKIDNYYDSKELSFFHELKTNFNVLKGLDKNQVANAIVVAEDMRKNYNLDSVFKSKLEYVCSKIPDEYKYLTFDLVCRQMFSDNVSSENEIKIINNIKDCFSIKEREAELIINNVKT
jgi:tellurite resistance protein